MLGLKLIHVSESVPWLKHILIFANIVLVKYISCKLCARLIFLGDKQLFIIMANYSFARKMHSFVRTNMRSHGRCYHLSHSHHNVEPLKGRRLRYVHLNVTNLPQIIPLFSHTILRALTHFICSHGQFSTPQRMIRSQSQLFVPTDNYS